MKKIALILIFGFVAADTWAGQAWHLPNGGKGCVLESSFGDPQRCEEYAELWSCPVAAASEVTPSRRYLLSGIMQTERVDAHESLGHCKPTHFWVQKVLIQN